METHQAWGGVMLYPLNKYGVKALNTLQGCGESCRSMMAQPPLNRGCMLFECGLISSPLRPCECTCEESSLRGIMQLTGIAWLGMAIVQLLRDNPVAGN